MTHINYASHQLATFGKDFYMPVKFLHLTTSYHTVCAQANTKAKQKHSIATEYTLRMLGLLQAAETVVGNQM